MQAFIISEAPIETARILDRKRLNKQVLECQWIIDGYIYKNRQRKPMTSVVGVRQNFKKRLYTNDPEHYKMFESYGKTDINMYFVDGEWIRYINGKRV